MSAGMPLTDEDRWPWLDAIGAALGEAAASGRNIVISCSALKRIYRDRLRAAAKGPVLFVLLDGAYETLKRRLVTRKGHFMPPSLLDSQLLILERPTADELAISVDVEPPVDEVVATILAALPAAEARGRSSAGGQAIALLAERPRAGKGLDGTGLGIERAVVRRAPGDPLRASMP